MRIDSSIIETIKAKADIAEVIGDYVSLTKRGQNHIGLCPFHSDTTPSLTVNSARGTTSKTLVVPLAMCSLFCRNISKSLFKKQLKW